MEVILGKIKNLNDFKSFGAAKASNAVLKNGADSFVELLNLIFR